MCMCVSERRVGGVLGIGGDLTLGRYTCMYGNEGLVGDRGISL